MMDVVLTTLRIPGKLLAQAPSENQAMTNLVASCSEILIAQTYFSSPG